jgi:hypothetical protein
MTNITTWYDVLLTVLAFLGVAAVLAMMAGVIIWRGK